MENKPVQILKIPPIISDLLDTIETDLPSLAGTYCYIFELPRSVHRRIGRLGSFTFIEGRYAYLGSALGAGGLRSRIVHHLKPSLAPHWHMDWLKPYLHPSCFIYYTGTVRSECLWQFIISSQFQINYPVPGFGSSDCRENCPAHLIFLNNILVNDIYTCLSNLYTNIIPAKSSP